MIGRNAYGDMIQRHVELPVGSGVACLCVMSRTETGEIDTICGKTFTKTQEGIQLCDSHMEEMHQEAHRRG